MTLRRTKTRFHHTLIVFPRGVVDIRQFEKAKGQPQRIVQTIPLQLAPPSEDRQLAEMKEISKLVANYLVEARSDSLCGAFFCNVLTR